MTMRGDERTASTTAEHAGGRSDRRPWLLAVAGASVVLSLASCSSGAPGGVPAAGPDRSGTASRAPSSGSGGLGVPLYVDPQGPAPAELERAVATGDPAAEQIRRIAEQPTATWVADHDPDGAFTAAKAVADGARAADRTAVLVAYTLPDRDCGLYSAGGAPDDGSYFDGIGALAAGIGDADAVVVLEPDAVAHTFAGCAEETAAKERYRQLATAVDILTERPGTRVYVDAGNATWVQDLPGLAEALRSSGVEDAAGFALNTSNFVSTAESVEYGRRLSAELGGAHFVVDTSRNGAPVPAGTPGGVEWCNPPEARIGEPPTTTTDDPLLDALLWVKQPGDSDGDCRPGEPAAGQWYHDLAVQLAS